MIGPEDKEAPLGREQEDWDPDDLPTTGRDMLDTASGLYPEEPDVDETNYDPYSGCDTFPDIEYLD